MRLWEKTIKSYKGVGQSFKRYYDAYGGWKGFVCSPYLHFALVLSIVVYPLWRCGESQNWYDLTLSILPDMLGFTLGGYTILLAFGNDRFLKLLSEPDDSGSPSDMSAFMRFNGTFVHFILMQVIAIVLAIIGSSWGIKRGLFAWMGTTTLIYAVSISVAAVFAIMRLAKIFEVFAQHEAIKSGSDDITPQL